MAVPAPRLMVTLLPVMATTLAGKRISVTRWATARGKLVDQLDENAVILGLGVFDGIAGGNAGGAASPRPARGTDMLSSSTPVELL